ncbi:MAG: TIGR01906 family membrane protein [Clostridia bacterium]|nr:TIGR01906 family membrane protein [Clostridia bacterium]
MTSRKLLAALCGILLSLAAAVAVLAFLLDGMGGSAPLMHSLMQRHAPPEATGLPQEHYPAMAEMITDYLSGREQTFQFSFADSDGVSRQCFRDYEQQHMADVKVLFDLCRGVLLMSVLALLALGGGAYALRDQRRPVAQGFLAGVLGVLLAVVALAVWGVLDFEGLFVLFHRLSFSNDLWQLNPQTDLLIRLMPLNFFIHYAALLGGTWLGALALFALAARHLSKRWKR